jgi:hypothetical protein
MCSQGHSGIITGFIRTGMRICGDRAGSMPAKPAAETPTIVIGESLTRIFFPTTRGSLAKRLTQ